MSIITVGAKLLAHDRPAGELLDVGVRNLLDHVAVELAQEYVRLMEEAAKADCDSEAIGALL